MPRKVVGVVSLLLHALALLIQVTTLLPLPWYAFTFDSDDFTFSLFSCVDCKAPYRYISPDCFTTAPFKSSAHGLYSLSSTLQQGSDLYFYSVCFSLLFLVLNIERLLALLRAKDYGHPRVLAVLAPLPCVTTMMGVVGWFGTIQPQFGACGGNSKGKEEPCVTAKTGPILALVSAILTIGAVSTLFVTFLRRDKGLDCGVTGIGEGKIIAFSFRNWLLAKIAPVLLIGIIFNVISFVLPWIKFEDSSDSYEGDLQYMLDSWESAGKVRYECLWGPACDSQSANPNVKFSCNAFKRLSLANSIYIGMEYCALLLLVLWLESMVYFALKREFGIPRLVYLWAPLTAVVHAVAVCIWFIYGKAKMGGSCEMKTGDTDVSFCAENGASFTVWEGLCLFFAAVFYELLYYRRRDGYMETDSVSPALPSKLDQTESDITEPPTLVRKAFEASHASPFTAKKSDFGLDSRSGTHLSLHAPNTHNLQRPTLETLEEKVYCVSCDEE